MLAKSLYARHRLNSGLPFLLIILILISLCSINIQNNPNHHSKKQVLTDLPNFSTFIKKLPGTK